MIARWIGLPVSNKIASARNGSARNGNCRNRKPEEYAVIRSKALHGHRLTEVQHP